MKKDPLVFVEHILDSINKIERFMSGVSEKEFFKDEKLQDALVRRIEIIGEAVKNIPYEFKRKYTHIPWKNIAGMRDKLTHHYFGVNLINVWKVVHENIPVLKRDIIEILEKEK